MIKRIISLLSVIAILLGYSITGIAATYSAIPEQIVCTPYGDLKTQVGLAWVTSKNGSLAKAQVVEKTGSTPNFASANEYTGDAGDIDNWRWHKVVVTGLKPETTYQYRVGDDSNWSNIGEFTTAPDTENVGSFTFIQVNDPQGTSASDYSAWGAALTRATNRFSDYKFIAHAGDHVNDGQLEDQWQWYFSYSQSIFSKSIFAGASGNHDVYAGNRYFYRFNYNMPTSAPTTSGTYYSFDYANTHFTVINAQAYADTLQTEWIRYDIAKNSKKWNIVLIHNPLYTNADHYAEVNVRNTFNAILNDQMGVDIIFAGHDHIYNRTYPILNNEPVTDGTYLTNQTVAGIQNVSLWDNPTGTVNYLNNACGTKFYNFNTNANSKWFVPLPFAGNKGGYQPYLATYAGVTVTENEIINSAYYTNGSTDTIIESTGIRKTTPMINPPKNVKKTFSGNTLTITWDVPTEQADNAVKQYVVYDENNAYTIKNKTYFVSSGAVNKSVKIPMSEEMYNSNSTNFVVKAIGTHSISEIGTYSEDSDISEPIDITATPGEKKVLLNWQALAAETASVDLKISLDGTNWTTLTATPITSSNALSGAYINGSVTTASTSAEVRGLKDSTKYYFKFTVTGGKNSGEYTASATTTASAINPGTSLWVKDIKNNADMPYSNINSGIVAGSYITVMNNKNTTVTIICVAALYDASGRLCGIRMLPSKTATPGEEVDIPISSAINTTNAQYLKILPYIDSVDPIKPGSLPFTLERI